MRFHILVPPTAWDTVDEWDKNLKAKFVKTCRLASINLSHPSLYIEKVNVSGNKVLRCRIDDHHRIHFNLPQGDQLQMRAAGGHRLEGIG